MVRSGAIETAIESDQVQPASLDLRLGDTAYQIRASFLPNSSNVMERIRDLSIGKPISLASGAVLEKGSVYIVQLMEGVRLDKDTFGIANPKSSTGRLDVFTRLITDKSTSFDRIDRSYVGPLFVEIAPLTFNIIVHTGVRLNQVRFLRGVLGGALTQKATEKYYSNGELIRSPDNAGLALHASQASKTLTISTTSQSRSVTPAAIAGVTLSVLWMRTKL
jgi:dCTP deaminase